MSWVIVVGLVLDLLGAVPVVVEVAVLVHELLEDRRDLGQAVTTWPRSSRRKAGSLGKKKFHGSSSQKSDERVIIINGRPNARRRGRSGRDQGRGPFGRDQASADGGGASTNLPSHRAMTAEARQLPMTLIVVRTMSIRLVDPEQDGHAFDRQVERGQRPGQDDQRRARHAGDALAGQHEGEDHDELLAEGQMDAGGLGDEDRGQREIERRAVQVEAVSRREDERDDLARNTERLHRLHGLGQGRFRARRGEGDDGRLLDRPEEPLIGILKMSMIGTRTRPKKDEGAGIEGQDQEAEVDEDREPLAADGHGDGRARRRSGRSS